MKILRSLFCCAHWAISLPIRILFSTIFLTLLTLIFPVAGYVNTHNWACKGQDFDADFFREYFKLWKGFLLDFILKGNWEIIGNML